MKRKIFLITSFSIVIDQIIKYIVSNCLSKVTIIPNFISLVYAQNNGVAFSMLSGKRVFIILASLILVYILVYMLNKEKEKNALIIWSYGILFGGIFGNLIDRIIRGVVVDYISISIVGYYFPIFNLADVLITIGVILLVISYFKESKSKL